MASKIPLQKQKRRRSMDAVSFHPYCSPQPPEKKLLTDFSKLKALAPGKPLWITEFGYPTHAGEAGVDEETQANYLVRAFLLARASPAIERVSWYDFQNDGEDPAEPEMNFGLVRKNLSHNPRTAPSRRWLRSSGTSPWRNSRSPGTRIS